MLLSDLVGKPIYSGKNRRGVCLGVSFSLKTYTVKYLLCGEDTSSRAEFAVGTGSIAQIDDAIHLKRLHTVAPKNCARFYIGNPVYSEEGKYLGVATDLLMSDFFLSKLLLNTDRSYSALAIAASGDAVILRREPLFPLGLRVNECIPAQPKNISKGTTVTKGILKTAIASGKLIYLTRRLLPLNFAYTED